MEGESKYDKHLEAQFKLRERKDEIPKERVQKMKKTFGAIFSSDGTPEEAAENYAEVHRLYREEEELDNEIRANIRNQYKIGDPEKHEESS